MTNTEDVNPSEHQAQMEEAVMIAAAAISGFEDVIAAKFNHATMFFAVPSLSLSIH